jgi:hypothetical protein
MRQPHAGMAVAEPVAQIDHLHSCPSLSEGIPSLTSFPILPRCPMLTDESRRKIYRGSPGRVGSAVQALVPTALPGVFLGRVADG